MSIGSGIKNLRKNKNISRKELAEKLDIQYQTLANYENDNREPNSEILIKIANFFNVTIDSILGITYSQEIYSLEEKEHIKKYRALKDNGIKKIIDDLLELEYQRIQEQDNADNAIYDDNGNRITSFQSYLNFKYQSAKALYIDKVSAGLGFFPVEEDYQPVGSPFSNADYAFQVDGDSMLPKYQNGDMIYVKKQSTLYDGEIGVVVYNGKGYLKQFYKDGADISLISLNEDYEDITITLDDDTSFYIVGKVVGCVPLKEFM